MPFGAEVSFLLFDPATGKTLFNHNANSLRHPASVQKLVTALGAKLILPKNYRFNTDIELKNRDVIIRFGGDPTLSSYQLLQLISKLKKYGSVINGNIYINGSAFDDIEHAVGVPWDNLGVCYSTVSSAITLDHNCVRAILKGKQHQSGVEQLWVDVAKDKPIKVSHNIKLLSKSTPSPYPCSLSLLSSSFNEYKITGCLNKRQLPLPLNFALQDTGRYTKSVVKTLLQKAGIKLHGLILRNDHIAGQRVARHQSAPIYELLDTMLTKSDNLIADNVLKAVGRYAYKQAGSYESGTRAIKKAMQSRLGIPLNNIVMVDGSGLSRNDRLTPSTVMKVLLYIKKHPSLGIEKMLPVSGEKGTLKYRSSVRKPPLKGNITAKTGTLFGTHNLAGFITTQKGHKLLFVEMVNNYVNGNTTSLMRFEKQLYQSIYEKY